MHRVLSYQTAMRASGSRDIREYVTKRTCVSLILSIAFFTLIAGFLLGKFVSDRQYHIKHINEVQLPPHIHPINDEFTEYKRAREQLTQTTRLLSEKYRLQHISSDSTNALIYNKYVACVQEGPEKQHEYVDIFVDNLLSSQTAKHIECLGILKDYINSLLLN
ncbi:uncharacterized protein LOC129611756 [Condylostylus longicornis]|uniref:uncharacterized protein LOC129611756 n=1 Tax=Condylostylus longicornis TaxID=2530218 RepID=UPI00244E1FE9|nr:uncharacterized protein LOC129611756 [Condylostylus longicornis]